MGGLVAPFVAVAMALALWATYQNNNQMLTPSTYALQASSDATTFLAYRDAVTSYMQANPSFTGTVNAASLSGQFPATFLAGAGNYVSPTGNTGRVITCWANVPTGTVQQAVTQAGVDASIGTSSGSTWVSAAPSAVATPAPLSTPVNPGDIVSVIQIGS
jgi:hypothetical protein